MRRGTREREREGTREGRGACLAVLSLLDRVALTCAAGVVPSRPSAASPCLASRSFLSVPRLAHAPGAAAHMASADAAITSTAPTQDGAPSPSSASAGPAPAARPRREVVCDEAVRWLKRQAVPWPAGHSVITSMPDVTETGLHLEPWKQGFTAAAALIMESVAPSQVAIFYQVRHCWRHCCLQPAVAQLTARAQPRPERPRMDGGLADRHQGGRHVG